MVEEAEAAEDYSLASKDLLDARLILIQVFVCVCLLLSTIVRYLCIETSA